MTLETFFLSAPLKPAALHIPDGFLSTWVAIAGWVVAVLVIAVALRQSRAQLGERQIPLLGVMAAFIFAAQAINFPVAGGTSGHLLGGALAAIVLGPWAALLVMASVIGLQALLFQDGGLLALGWNIVNMGVLTAFTGALLYRLARRLLGPSRTSIMVAGVVGAWLSVEAGAIATALQLAVSGTAPLGIVLPAMAGVHALIGVGEALITVGALLLLAASRPDLLVMGEQAPGTRAAGWVATGLLAALVVAGLSFLASPAPDGLERVAMDSGFIDAALDPLFQVLPDYTIPFIGHETLAGVTAVVLGTVLVFALVIGLGRALRRPPVSR
ncbi:MAG TPA: energy-coupling factor ABC transporter permease [Caldilineaceae bacterium]|nr:energy-coupling factor ABC transporter permease [Caldilineaceae bacterium]